MKLFLLSALVAASAAGAATASVPHTVGRLTATETSRSASAQVRPIKTLTADKIIHHAAGNAMIGPDSRIGRPASGAVTKSQIKDGYVLYENFSGWDGTDPFWVPEGWTVDHRGDCSLEESWTPCAEMPLFPGPADGEFFYGINYSLDEQDEWFISPEVEPAAGMQLSYWIYLDPMWLYSMDNLDWDTYEYIGDKIVAYTLQILVQPEDGEWTVLRDYAEEYKDWTFDEMMAATPSALEKHSVSLEGYTDRKIRVAFRYVGCDGNTLFIDAIGIGYPELEDVCYMNPLNTLYWGLTSDADMTYLTSDYVLYPVYAPLTWSNYSGEEATYCWTYCDPVTAEFVTSDDQDELTVTYVPDYRSAASLKNNFFYPPTLTGSAPGATDGSYTAPYRYFQAGGKAEVTVQDGREINLTLLPFGINGQGLTRITVSDDALGAMNIPVFGHNEFSDSYWLNYSLNGEKPLEGNFSHLLGIGNIFYASYDAATVVNGISVYGWGKIADDAELTATIYGINADMSSSYSTFTVIGRAAIRGSEIERENQDGSNCYLCLPFSFDEPVIVQASEEHPAFVIMFEGFHSDKVEYFAPLQSAVPDMFGMTYGYILNEINLDGHIDRGTYYSFKRMVYCENGEYTSPEGAFAIGLDAEYPWLTTECEEICLGKDDTEANVQLGSYYDGSRLTVEAPEGLAVSVAGRYDRCALTVTRESSDTPAVEGVITVKGPGVGVTIPVKAEPLESGIETVTSSAFVTGIFDLTGRRIDSTETGGVYIVKYSDGSVRKVTVK